ncbi:MAG TPA: 16S rRNA (cytosine(1402)-N(4))-methyltransferase RsmH [Gammaproteobacteria bacterium]|nr:16S rRNA (cytosine(1402)-N(4))-methyltransferase RsmH [Gammaproteobacteria bacterium]
MNERRHDQPGEHAPVLLDESVAALQIRSDGVYVDGTFGRGGHSRAILAQLGANGRLLVIDKDPEALIAARQLAEQDQRVTAFHGAFTMLERMAGNMGVAGQVDGILLDLGVSSPQFDDSARGFSFRAAGPLDMRMDPSTGESAAEWLARAPEDEITEVIRDYGEERFARRIARAVCQTRLEKPIEDTAELAALVARAVPTRERNKHPATRAFQAIRIFINRELDELRDVLEQTPRVLAGGGRLCVITFHSLEDRIVKRFMRAKARAAPDAPRGLGAHHFVPPVFARPLKAVTPGAAELAANPRARSARLRVVEKRA